MTDEFHEVFREVTSSSAALGDLHPRRLDRWWKALVGAPDPIYMQLGCNAIFKQIDLAAAAIRHMIDLLGPDNLPVSPREVARRHIREFRWHVTSSEDGAGTFVFLASWNKDSSAWHLTCAQDGSTTKSVKDLETAVEKAQDWASELDAQLRENAAESE